MQQPSNRRHSSAGYNIVEVLIATAILGVVALSIFTLFFLGQRNVYSGKQVSQAIVVGTQVMEDLSPLNKRMIYNGAFNIADTAVGEDFTFPRVSGSAAMSFTNSLMRSTSATVMPSPPTGVTTENTPPGLLTRWQSLLGTKLGNGSSVTLILTPDQDPANSPAQFASSQLLRIRVIVRWNETGRRREAIWDTVKAY